MADALLDISGLFAGYGPTTVLEDVNLAIGPGESIGIVGRNGMGKTSLLGAVVGRVDLHRGAIRFEGKDIGRLPIHERARRGIGLVPQEREIFPSLTVRENLAIAARKGPWNLQRVYELFPRLKERETNRGNQLSGGEQQMLSIGRALMGNPRLLLLDEPSEGLAPVIVDELVAAMRKLYQEGGMSVVLVEQHVSVVFELSRRTVVMSRGRVAFDGPSAQLEADEALLNSLIGVGGDAVHAE